VPWALAVPPAGEVLLTFHFVSQATFEAVQNIPMVFPDEPLWQRGSDESWHSVFPVHIVVHAATEAL